MGYTQPNMFIMPIAYNNISPGDSTAYYLGSTTTFSGVEVLNRVYVNTPCRIVGVHIYWYNNTQDASAENVVFVLRKNDTSNTALYTGNVQNATAAQNVTGLNITLASGDFFHVLMTTPAWVTNPTGQYLLIKVLVATT